MIYARVDVRMPTHRRFVKAGPAAVGYWAAALCYSRGEELDGHLPAEAVGLILALGDRDARKLADRLCLASVDLFKSDGAGGYWILKYDEFNETKAQIEQRRAQTRKRVGKHRSNAASNAVTNIVTNASGNGNVPGSGSVSSEISSSEIRDPTCQVAVEAQPLPPTGRLPDGVVAFERPFWVAAYERAVIEARGDPGWVMPQKQVGALRAVIESRAGAEERKDLGAWIDREVREFVRSVLCLGVPFGIYSAFAPDGLQRWYNEGRPGRDGEPSATRMRASVPLQPVGEGPRLWKAGK